jgi:hypothetical protein
VGVDNDYLFGPGVGADDGNAGIDMALLGAHRVSLPSAAAHRQAFTAVAYRKQTLSTEEVIQIQEQLTEIDSMRWLVTRHTATPAYHAFSGRAALRRQRASQRPARGIGRGPEMTNRSRGTDPRKRQ